MMRAKMTKAIELNNMRVEIALIAGVMENLIIP
jgi:hypothetical protein